MRSKAKESYRRTSPATSKPQPAMIHPCQSRVMEATHHSVPVTKAISFHYPCCQPQTRIQRPVSPCSVLVVSMSASAQAPVYLFPSLSLYHQTQTEPSSVPTEPASRAEDGGVHDCYDASRGVNKRGFRDQWFRLGTRYLKGPTGWVETEGRRAVMRRDDISWYRYRYI